MTKAEKKLKEIGISKISREIKVSRQSIYYWIKNPRIIMVVDMEKLKSLYGICYDDFLEEFNE